MQARAISEFSSQLQFGETGKPKESQFRASGTSSFLSVAQSIVRNTTPGDGGDTQTESAGVTVELGSALPDPDAGSKGGKVVVIAISCCDLDVCVEIVIFDFAILRCWQQSYHHTLIFVLTWIRRRHFQKRPSTTASCDHSC